MKTMRRRPRRRAPRGALYAGALAVGALLAGGPAEAQDRPPRREMAECRCVDRDGNEIEDCSCLRVPRFEGMWVGPSGSAAQTHARLGVGVSSDQASRHDARGARVESVMDDGPADEAGIREGDVITRVDGRSLLTPIDDEGEEDFDLDRSVPVQRLLAIVRDVDPGDRVEVTWLSGDEERTATLEARELGGWGSFGYARGWDAEHMADRMRALGDRVRDLRVVTPDTRSFDLWSDSAGAPRVRLFSTPGMGIGLVRSLGGLDLVELNPGLSEYFGVSGGVLVADIEEDSPLALEPGDVVLAVGGREVDGPDHLRRILRSYEPDEAIEFRVVRHEREMSVQGRLAR